MERDPNTTPDEDDTHPSEKRIDTELRLWRNIERLNTGNVAREHGGDLR